MKALFTTRYVTPLREGGSVPALVECNDEGLYVLKLRGAAQGKKALIAELVAGELGRALGLPVPELALVTLDPALSRTEPDTELRELLKASAGLNLGLDYLPGSVMFDPVVGPPPDPTFASSVVWFDALVTNVDRTAKNPNLLVWHQRHWLIDHGASLVFHHAWDDAAERAKSPFTTIHHHVLLPWASELSQVGPRLRARLGAQVIDEVLAAIPDEWLLGEPRFVDPAAHRAGYRDYFLRRLDAAERFQDEAQRAHAQLV